MLILPFFYQDLRVSTDHLIYFLDYPVQRIFNAIIFGYKGVIQLIALLLAFRTRNIKVKGLDDAKFIISTVYITTIGIVVIAMAFYVLREFLIVYTATVSLTLFFTTVVILGLVFIPKVKLVAGYPYHSDSVHKLHDSCIDQLAV